MITRANVEAELVDRCGVLLTYVGKDGATVNGTNAALNGPIREALGSLGLAVAGWVVADSDLVAVTSDQLPQLFDVAELRCLKNVLGSLTKVDQQVGASGMRLGQVRTDLMARVAALQALLRSQYGYGLGTMSAGALDLNFAMTDPLETEPLLPFGNA